MKEYMSKAEMIEGIILGISELRYYKIYIDDHYGNPVYLDSLSDIEIERIYNQISDKLKEVENFYK